MQTKFTVQELGFSGKHGLSARTLVPVWVKGRPIAPLFPADLTPRCGGFRVPPGGGEKTIVLSKAISAIAITTAAVRPALRRGQQEHQEQQQGRSNCRDAGSRPTLRRGQQEHHEQQHATDYRALQGELTDEMLLNKLERNASTREPRPGSQSWRTRIETARTLFKENFDDIITHLEKLENRDPNKAPLRPGGRDLKVSHRQLQHALGSMTSCYGEKFC